MHRMYNIKMHDILNKRVRRARNRTFPEVAMWFLEFMTFPLPFRENQYLDLLLLLLLCLFLFNLSSEYISLNKIV